MNGAVPTSNTSVLCALKAGNFCLPSAYQLLKMWPRGNKLTVREAWVRIPVEGTPYLALEQEDSVIVCKALLCLGYEQNQQSASSLRSGGFSRCCRRVSLSTVSKATHTSSKSETDERSESIAINRWLVTLVSTVSVECSGLKWNGTHQGHYWMDDQWLG